MSAPGGFSGPVFLVGLPRSGTKLVRAVLNEHPAVAIPANETEFLPDWVRRWASWGDLSDRKAFQRFYRAVQGSIHFVNLREEHGRTIDPDAWFDACRAFDPPGVFEALIRLEVGIPFGSTRVWGDKSPGYVRHIPLLYRLFPSARFVHVIRDARDHCLSMREAFGKNVLRAAQRWADGIEAARLESHRVRAEYHEIRYEDLVSNSERTVGDLCRFLGLRFMPTMLRFSTPPENLGRTRGQCKIVQDNTERYRTEMDSDTVRRIEEIAGATLARLGFEVAAGRASVRLSPLRLRAHQIADGCRLIARDSARRGWMGAARFRLRAYRESRAPEARTPDGRS